MKNDHPRPFHDYDHAREYDRKASRSGFRAQLAGRLEDLLELRESDFVLDIATGTGRFARLITERLTRGAVFGIDGAAAMLRVGREAIDESVFDRYFQTVGAAEALPFAAEVFDRAFVAFAFHHFGETPQEIVCEAHRVLKPRGRFVILDPVFAEPCDSVDDAVQAAVHQSFRRVHGENFHFYSAPEIQAILEESASWTTTVAEVQQLSFDQTSPEGIPTARHWVEAAEALEAQSDDVKRRFQETYFRYIREGEGYRIVGSLRYALVCAVK